MGKTKILLWDLYAFQKDFHLRDLEEEDLEAVLKKAEEAKAELVNLQKSNQIQKYNIAYFQEQLEDLQVTNTQLNAMLIMEKETTELVKA